MHDHKRNVFSAHSIGGQRCLKILVRKAATLSPKGNQTLKGIPVNRWLHRLLPAG
jgi:hypothetical protein